MDIRSPADVGRFVRLERKRLGLSQSALADRVGVSRNWLSTLEAGKSGAELGLALAALRALGALLVATRAEALGEDLEPGARLVATAAPTLSGSAPLSFAEVPGAAVAKPPTQAPSPPPADDPDFPAADDAVLDHVSARRTPRK